MTTETHELFVETPTRPEFDREVAQALAGVDRSLKPLSADTLAAARRVIDEGRAGVERPDLTVSGSVVVEERCVPGPGGAPDVTLLVLRPTDQAAALPAVYHTHGGGMVLGNRRNGVEMLLPYVSEGLAVVVSVEYRLAPEHPDPAPVEDCYAGLVWIAQHAATLGIDSERIIVTGASAGGGLAAGITLLARDRGFPALTHQVLLCPMLDDRFETPSSRMLDGEGTWDRRDNFFGWSSLLGERRGGPDVSPYAAPARVADPAGLPPTYIDVGSAESFRDEALTYAQRLSQAGVSVDLHMFAGGVHGYEGLAPDAAISRATTACRDEYFRRALAG